MTTVTMHDTPSAQIINEANAIETITVGDMTIGLRKPNILTQYRIVEALGASAKNEVYMGMVMPLLWVVQINGDAIPPHKTKMQLEALIQRLDEDGVGAIMSHFTETAEAATDKEEALKN